MIDSELKLLEELLVTDVIMTLITELIIFGGLMAYSGLPDKFMERFLRKAKTDSDSPIGSDEEIFLSEEEYDNDYCLEHLNEHVYDYDSDLGEDVGDNDFEVVQNEDGITEVEGKLLDTPTMELVQDMIYDIKLMERYYLTEKGQQIKTGLEDLERRMEENSDDNKDEDNKDEGGGDRDDDDNDES